MDRVLKLDKNAKREEVAKSFTNCVARPGGSQTTICVPVPKNCTVVDLQIDTNLSVPCFKTAAFFSHCSILFCIFSILSLVLLVRYQDSELTVMEQNIMALKQQVEILAEKSGSLNQEVDALQSTVRSLTYKYRSIVGNTTFVNVTDMINRSMYSGVEHSNFLPTSTVSLPYDSSDVEYVVSDDETIHILQELKLENINNTSASPLDILFRADGSSSREDVATGEGLRVDREKRSNRRGNHKPSEGRRHLNNKRKNRGPSVVHLKGAVPDVYIEDGGLVAPWYVDKQGAGDFLLSKFQMREGNGAIQISERGLYYIYAQVYYLTTESSNSFAIRLREEGKSSPEELALCSVKATGNGETSEVSCFTSVVRFLNATDRLFVWQRERNRRVILRDGCTFFGVVHLNGKRD
ncbi:uncharacterized protein LOC110828012 isoform X4 [Zootermopsis nevadensis]|uniref:uncharacterized protein LOC110828012 isoform X4 n=1 Tax=Zootermopsis nevadensis TaxID=136037 RepID=UPI000B8EB15D|nr:uncharacterized protein LOC110828012 isoform X4 [Zootermopsis nevadensis]